MIPKVTMSTKMINNRGLIALLNMIIDGNDNAVTAIMNDKIVPNCTPFENNASAIGIVPKISAYIGIPTSVAIMTLNGLFSPRTI